MLTGRYRQKLDIPHEPGEWIEVRMLSWKQLHEAREARSAEVLANARAMGVELLQSLPGQATPPLSATDPLADYDLLIVLRGGIVAWSYDERVTPSAVEQLDEVTANWAAHAIIRLGQATEADRKNA